MKNLLINGVTYENVNNIKLPTAEGGTATYVDYDITTRYKITCKSSKFNYYPPVLKFNENKKQYSASMALLVE